MRVSPRILFEQCYGNYAIAAVNVFNMEQVLGLFRAGTAASAPFLVQLTPVARDYAGPSMLMHMISAAAKIYPKAVYAVHLDHGNERHVLNALGEGYDSVMIDASHDDFKTNVARTRKVVLAAHAKGVAVEAELGILSGVEDDLAVDEDKARFTDPDQVAEFVTLTDCDSLAVAVGTSHGAYKFSGKQGLRFDILAQIQERLPRFPIVLHGASSVDPNEIQRINSAGGSLAESASGVAPEELVRAIRYGVCKVNIATDARLLWARVHREFFRDAPEQFDPLIPGKSYMDDYETLIKGKFDLLGAVGKAEQFNTKQYT